MITKINLSKKYDLPILFSLILLPLASITILPFYIYYNGVVWQEPVIFIIGWFLAGMGITIGYHRLFAHKSFKTYPLIEWLLMIFGSMALQNTILNWCSDHRRHHKKLDTKDDPYSITEGFLHAHVGWVVKKNDYKIDGVDDLKEKSSVKFQTKYYWSMALILSFVIPLLIGLLFSRPIGGLLWGGVLRVTLVHHFTFFINSLCHFIGKRPYQMNTTARDSWFMALFTFGEGYHNYHHKFQWDYRNGIKWYSFDPSKWIIKSLSYFKITYNLRKASELNIMKAKISTLNEKIINMTDILNIKKYRAKTNIIMKQSSKYLKLWLELDKKYKEMKKKKIGQYDQLMYEQKKKFYRLELQKSISSLMLIFINIKNYSI